MKTRQRHRESAPGRASRRNRRPVVLAGDIGGTKTNLGLFEVHSLLPLRLACLEQERFESRAHGSLGRILTTFLASRPVRFEVAAFGVAGPVINGRCSATNLPWVVDAAKLSRSIEVPVALLNDLETTAHAIPHLGRAKLRTLNAGRPVRNGNLGLIAAGTGLGEAFVFRGGSRFLVGASEGGHCSFAPRDGVQVALLEHLQRTFGHVSVERVLSGAGLERLYDFPGLGGEPAAGGEDPGLRADASGDRAAAISHAALSGSSARAAAALELFASIYGAEAGNMALKYLATGGVYIGGGIAPRILPALERGGFMEAFVDKGRFRALLSAIPVRVILDDNASLQGAAAVAAGMLHR